MNIELAKIAIDKMAFFVPEDVLNDLYKDHDATAEVLVHDENRVVFSIVYHDKKDKRILSITVKRNEVNVYYNSTMQVFSHRIDDSFYNDVLNVLFDTQTVQTVKINQTEKNDMTNTVTTISAQLDGLTFGLNVVTKYMNNKVTATLKHGSTIKTTVKVSYDYSMNSNENHLNACLVCLEKVLKEYDKNFAVISYSYNEKDDGYSFTCTRIL